MSRALRFVLMSAQGAAIIASATQWAAAAPAVTEAPNDASDKLEEIVVTAEKKTENLQKAPVAITVISGQEMVAQGATDIRSIDRLAPGIDIGDERDTTQIYIRGIGSEEDTGNTDPAVAVNINEVYQPRNTTTSALYDVDQVEVLYGPQGTLYGRNAAGGVINFATKMPGDTAGGEASFETGNYALIHPFLAVDVPISDQLKTRIAVNFLEHSGYLSNGLDDQKSIAGRLTTVYTPTDQLSFLIIASAYHNSSLGNAVVNIPLFNASQPWFYPGNPREYGRFGDASNQEISTKVVYKFNDQYSLTYIPAFVKFNDSNDTAADGTTLFTRPSQGQNTQELRFTSDTDQLKWQSGLYWYQAKTHEQIVVTPGNTPADPGLGDPPLPAAEQSVAPGYLHINLNHFTEKTSYAAFSQATYAVADATRITAGLRYSWDQTRGEGDDSTLVPITAPGSPAGPLCENFLCPVPGVVGIPNVFTGNQITRDLSWKLSIDHDLTPSSMIYGSAQTGYTEGGFFFAPAPDNIFRPQHVLAFTAGSKNRFFDDRFQVNDEVFYYNYRDYQISIFNLTTGITDYFAAQKARIYGNQLDLKFRITQADLFTLGTTIMSPKAVDFSTPISPFGPGGQTVFNGYTLPFAPQVTLTASLEHTWNFASGATLVGFASTHYESSKWGTFQHATGTAVPSYDKTDATLTYTFPGHAWSVAAWGRNLTNAVSFVTVTSGGNPGPGSALIDPPRTYGMRVDYKF
jgi:iron complex outermembrane receptor protein